MSTQTWPNEYKIKLSTWCITAINLLELMLELDAERRITAERALAHAYLAQYADPTDEPVSLPYDQSFEDMDLPVEKWKGECFDSLPPYYARCLRIVQQDEYFLLWYLCIFFLVGSQHVDVRLRVPPLFYVLLYNS